MHKTHSQVEQELLAYWDAHRTFARSVEERPTDKRYTFYDGPPFATGLPHYGSILPSVIKDVIPRYWTMKGYRVERRWGWDCHGIPIENMIEKELDLEGGKKGIEELGIDKFNAACRSAILRFDKEWEVIIKRVARWVDFENSYKTMDSSFMESVWWAFKTLHDKDLAYQGRRVILYCPRCATPLSNFEIAMDNSYKDLNDLTVTAEFELVDRPNVFILAWTTTPWTLPGNAALAVNPNLTYVEVTGEEAGNTYIVAASRVEAVFKNGYKIVKTMKGSDLVGQSYKPLFPYYVNDPKTDNRENGWKVYAADFVTADDGTGVVHIAPGFGEDDMKLGQKENLPFIQHVDMEGAMKSEVTDFAGLQVKPKSDDEKIRLSTDIAVLKYLQEHGTFFAKEKVTHAYPVCYRCETPLYYNAVPAWFINVQKLKPELAAQNENINWYPEHLKQGRFGKGLETAPDWNISRSRYWGTPMPVWIGETTGKVRILGSYEDLKMWAVDPSQVAGLTDYHREFIDPIEVWVDDERTEKGRRIPEVFDCWVESGSMPYAAIHAPFENKEQFAQSFPAQFITEYIAQTRAWFYVMHVMSVGLFGRNAYENVLTTGTILAADGSKMSKSKKNYPDPTVLIEKHSADALRFYLMSQPLVNGENLSFSEAGVDEVAKKFINIMRNVLAFYQLYAEHDDWTVEKGSHVLDKWIDARLQETLQRETASLEVYNLSDAARTLQAFVTDLSTWYIRRSRDRMKTAGDDRTQALATLRTTLLTFSKMLAPFMPFLAENIYLEIMKGSGKSQEGDSVHLALWPEQGDVNEDVLAKMGEVRAVVSRVMEMRDEAGRPVKQALGSMTITVPSGEIEHEFIDVILDEVNVKKAEVKKGDLAVGLDIALTPELIREGMAREVTRRVNGLRKEAGLTIADRIDLKIWSTSDEVKRMFDEHADTLKSDTLATAIAFAQADTAHTVAFRVAEHDIAVGF